MTSKRKGRALVKQGDNYAAIEESVERSDLLPTAEEFKLYGQVLPEAPERILLWALNMLGRPARPPWLRWDR